MLTPLAALLIAGFDNALVGANCQVAYDGCFDVNLTFHEFNLGLGNRGLSPISQYPTLTQGEANTLLKIRSQSGQSFGARK